MPGDDADRRLRSAFFPMFDHILFDQRSGGDDLHTMPPKLRRYSFHGLIASTRETNASMIPPPTAARLFVFPHGRLHLTFLPTRTFAFLTFLFCASGEREHDTAGRRKMTDMV